MSGRRLSFRARLLIMVVVLVGLGSAVPATVLIERQRRDDWNNQAEALQRAARVQAQRLERAIEDLGSDTAILAEVPPVGGIIRATRHQGRDPADGSSLAGWRRRLEIIFAAFAASRPDYIQLRLIGAADGGREIVRVNRDDGLVVAVPEEGLQKKGDRGYFSEASQARAGLWLLSDIDLNQEYGILDDPPNPVLRSVLPLRDEAGEFFGAVVVNLSARSLLAELERETPAGVSLYVAGNRGDWLVHPDPARRFGIDLGHGHGWHEEFSGLTRQRGDGGAVLRPLPSWPDGVTRFAVTQTVAPWVNGMRHPLMTLAYVVTEDALNAQLLPLFRGIVAVSALVGSSMLLLAAAVVGRVTSPLASLANAAKLVAEGRYDIHLPKGGSDELGLLIESFRHLRERVWRREWDLRQLNSELEQRVEARTRDLVIARNQAEQSTRAKAEFLANMSHEIRTPMNAMLGLGYILERQELAPESRDLLRKLQRSGRTLQGIIDDILNFSKLEAGRFSIDCQPFRLAEVQDSVATIMSTAAADKDLELVISPAGDGVDWVVGDALRLEQVLINLVNNAVKFTEKGMVELKIETIRLAEDRVALRFVVSDTGIGMSDDHLAKVFAPFVQADPTVERRYGGTGLGLSISRQLVALMGGELSVRSQLGMGSRFEFTLDFARPSGCYVNDMVALDVVVADDSPAAREALRRSITALGWVAHVVESGDDAVQAVTALAGARAALVVVLDWQMPGMDGLEALRILRNTLERPQDTVILMVTGYAREELAEMPDAALADALLTKPVTASMVYDAVIAAKWKRGQRVLPGRLDPGCRLAGLRLLVVDDNDINREVAERIFTAEGARTWSVASGREALVWLEQHGRDDVDVVLMDVQMPGMDGLEATRLLRGLEHMADLPVIALTAGALPEHRQAALRAGMNDFLAKPFDVNRAITLLAGLCGRVVPPAGDVAPVAVPAAAAGGGAEDFPGLDEASALALWRERAVFIRYLRKFVADGDNLVAAIAAAPPDDGARMAHKLKGTAGNLGLIDVVQWSGEVDRMLRHDGDAQAGLAALDQVMTIAMSSARAYLARYGGEAGPPPASAPVLAPGGTADLGALLRNLQAALDADTPDTVEPLLAILVSLLPAARLLPVVEAVEAFDFRLAEERVRDLMVGLGLDVAAGPVGGVRTGTDDIRG